MAVLGVMNAAMNLSARAGASRSVLGFPGRFLAGEALETGLAQPERDRLKVFRLSAIKWVAVLLSERIDHG
jgi:hypothetical protein